MNQILKRSMGIALLVILSACSTLPTKEAGVDGVACVGMVGQLPAGLAVAANDALLNEARGVTDKGGVCAAKVWQVKDAVKVYRVYDGSRSTSMYGRWWALSKPTESRADYREHYAICKNWSALNRLVSCTLKPNSQIVIGTTQSIQCEDGVYPKSANIQVYVPNTPAALLVENCQEEGAWGGE